MGKVEEFINHIAAISEKPWSSFTSADYSLKQWHDACLIHNHTGAYNSKIQCKLPVRTPDGVLNRSGVHAAAAVLAGARGGVIASTEDKDKAAKALIAMYKQLNEDPPPSLLKHSTVEDFLDHHGVKGQKWGVRNKKTTSAVTTKKHFTLKKNRKAVAASKPHAHQLSDQQLRDAVNRMNLEKQYSTLVKGHHKTKSKAVSDFIVGIGSTAVKGAVTGLATQQVGKALQKAVKVK